MKNMKERKEDSNPENCMSRISKRKKSRIMRKGTVIFVAAMMTMMAATPLLFGTTEKAGADADVGTDVGAKEVKTDYPLAFYNAGVTFEPLEGKVNIPENYKSSPNGYYIVQYDGLLSADYKETIESMGGSVVGYIPKFAHLVCMGRETKEEVEKLPYVRWIGFYEPYYKVEKDLLDATGEVILTIVPFPMQPLKLENKLSKDYLNQMVEVIEPHRGSELMKESTEKRYGDLDFEKDFSEKDFSEKDFAPIMQKEIKGMGLGESKVVPTGYNFDEFREKAAKLTQEIVLKQMGGEILPVDITPEYIRVRIDASKIPTIAKFGWVKSIYEWHPHQLHGTIEEIRNYTSAHIANLAGWNAGESWNASWDRSDPPDELVRLSISDTGAMYTHEQFGDDPGCYDAFSGTLPFTNERIFCYRFDGGDGPDNCTNGGGHGTATTSILVGNCDDSPLEREPIENAPNLGFEGFANMGIVEVAEKSNLQGSDGTGSLSDILNAAYGDDCVVHSVSWGSATGDTGEYVEEWAYNNPNMLIFWAAGNDNGSENVGNVAKNIVVVGGINDNDGSQDVSTHYDGGGSDGFTPDTGRVKPDLVMSYEGSRPADCDSNIAYWDSFSGTSGSTPMAAGQAGVIHEMWRHDFFKNGGSLTDRPSSAVVKAMMINTANDSMMTNTPGHYRWQTGWGEPSIGNVYEIGSNYGYRIWDIDETPARTEGCENWTTWVQSSSTQPFNVTLSWLDDPSSTGTLVNDLDLTVIDESGNKYYGNHGLNWSRWSTANPAGDNEWDGSEGGKYDHVNNVENVRIQNPVNGRYKIVVNWHSTSSPQSFALVVSGVPKDAASLKLDEPIYNYADKGTITLVDTDENTNHSSEDTATAQFSIGGCDPFNVTLIETGANTSTFTADFYVVKDFPDVDNIKLANSSSVTMVYRSICSYTIIIAIIRIDNRIIIIITLTVVFIPCLCLCPIITANYGDSWNSGANQGYFYANSSYDGKAPTISDVRDDYLTHTGFGFSFETDEPARALFGIWLRWNESKSPREDAYLYMPELDYYLNFYDFATLDDIRNQSLIDSGDVEMLLLFTTGMYATEHSLAILGAYPDADIYYLIGAFDEAGNTYIDDNGGNYYHVHTVPQDSTILFVGDDAASSMWLGIPYDAYSGYLFTMYAGYWPWFKEANITSCIVDSDPFGNYSDPWNQTTFGNFWNSFNASANNSKNILHWDVGLTNTFYGYTSAGTVAAQNVMVSLFSAEVSSYFTDMEPNTLTPSERTKISNFHNAGGRISYFGASYWEANSTGFGNTGSIGGTWVRDYMHVNMVGLNVGADDPGDCCAENGTAVGFDVTYGFAADNSGADNFDVDDWNCGKIGFYPGANARVDGQLLTENYAGSDIDDSEYIDVTCMSGDELNISGINNAQIELYYGTNACGYRPSLNASAVSWTDGTSKTYYNAVGWMGWNVYMTCVDKPSDPLYVDTWYKQLYDWYLDGSIQCIKGYADSMANVSVCAYEANSDHTVPIGSARTNETGKYEMMVHVPATPGYKNFDLIACKPYYRDANCSVNVTRGTDAWANFTMSKGVGNVTGIVTVKDPRWGPNPNPNFLTDVRVRIVNVTSVSPYKVDENTTVCGNGHYYFSGLPDGTYNVTVYGRRWINSSSPYDNFIETKYNSGVSVTGNQTTWANFTTDSGGISGRVYDSEGKPIKDAIVFAVEDGNPLKEEYRVGSTFWQSSGKALTGSSGGFYIGMLASGTYDLCALANGEYIVRRWNESIDYYDDWEYQAYGYYNRTRDNDTISLGDETLNADFCLSDSWATIRGRVSNASGSISGAAVYMELTSPSWMAGYTATYGYTYTDCNGDYYVRVPTAESGTNSTYKVKVMKVHHKPNEADINVQGGGTYWHHNVSLTPGTAANVLMVFEWDSDKTDVFGTYNHMFNDALNDSGCTGSYDTWNISWVSGGYMWRDETHYQPLLSDMLPYDVVLFFYEDANIYPEKTFPNANAEHIKAYLKAGGSVGMFAHEWRYGAGSNTDLMLNYFFATYIGDDGASDATTLEGVADDPISGDGDWVPPNDFTLTTDHAYEDRIEGDEEIFEKTNGPDRWCAIRSNENTRSWKSTWFGFCITDFTGTSGTADVDFKKLINNTVCWLADKTNYAPTLSNASVTPEEGNAGDTFNYTVCYTDPSPNSAVQYVNLIIDDGTPINITGNRIGDNDYTNGEIFYYNYGSPSGWHQGMHTYRFEAFDGAFDATGAVGTYAGPWINDTVPPVIEHRPAWSWDNGEEIAIGCTVTDNVEVANVTLYYKDVGDSSWHHTVMIRIRIIVVQFYRWIWWAYLVAIPSYNSTDTVCYYIEAEDTSGNSVIITSGVANLKATKLSSGTGVKGVNLTWDTWAGADKYNIYRSTNKWSFNFASPYDDTTNTYWVDNAANLSAGGHQYYIVRAYNSTLGIESCNSTMAVWYNMNFTGDTNTVYWISLPTNISAGQYDHMSDIVTDIEGGTGSGTHTYIDKVGYQLGGSLQKYEYDYLWDTGWTGTNSEITPGMGIYIELSGSNDFNWTVTGTDKWLVKEFSGNTNTIYWISIPQAGDYHTMSDIVTDIEGGTGSGTHTYIDKVGYQLGGSLQKYEYDYLWDTGWTGTNSEITPGMGIYIELSGDTPSFTWDTDSTPVMMVTHPMPISSYKG